LGIVAAVAIITDCALVHIFVTRGAFGFSLRKHQRFVALATRDHFVLSHKWKFRFVVIKRVFLL
jgi:hypothetical protein